ncbi:MAG: NADH-quinone oxidoreductase subunit N [Gemmataceae bacterium]
MFLHPQLVDRLLADLGDSLVAFLPELILCGAIVIMLLLRLVSALDRVHLGWLALAAVLGALGVSWGQWQGCCFSALPKGAEMFTGLLAYDNFTIFVRLFLFGFTALVLWLSLLTGIPDREDSADFNTLLLGSTVGMALMASANHLMMVFIAVEMASLPSFALAGYLKGRRQSSEAALKYVVYGGGSAGIMLYGISLISGKFGTGYLPDLAQVLPTAVATGFDPVLSLGLVFVLIGIAFKLAAVPFHFWCPDVFEGAATEVAAFLSVASKGAALALLGRITLVLNPGLPSQAVHMAPYLIPLLAVLAALTATFGNLAAYAQTNLKRLLAYSTIAHAGYMMMGLATLTTEGASAVLFYLVVYLFMNLGAFAVVAFLRNQTGSEDLSSYGGLILKAPVMVITLGVFLLSLLGLPPLGGFVAKLQIFLALVNAGTRYVATGSPGLGYIMYALLVIGGLNTVFSAVYYIKVLKTMTIDPPPEAADGKEPTPLPIPVLSSAYAIGLAVLVTVLGILWNPLAVASDKGVQQFTLQTTASVPAPKVAEVQP